MKSRRLISLMLVFMMIVAPSEAFAAEKSKKVYLCEGFGRYETYSHEIDGYSVSDSASVKITDMGKRNKALLLQGSSPVTISKNLEDELNGKFVYSIQLKRDAKSISASIGLIAGKSKYELVKINKNSLVMKDGKVSKKLNSIMGAKLSLVVDSNAGIVSIYVNDGCVIDEWKMSATASSYDGIYLTKEGESGNIYIDSIAVYSGDELLRQVEDTEYSPAKAVDMYLDQYPNNYTFFDSDYIVTAGVKYLDATLSKTGNNNTITAEKFDYKNTEKGNRIIFHKEDDDSTYNQTILNMGTTMYSELYPETYYYRHYFIEGDFCMSTSTMGGHLLFLRDTSAPTARELSVITYTDGGNIRITGIGNVAKIEPGKWHHIAMYVDLDNHKGDLFLDGNMVTDFSFSDIIKNISIARLSVTSGKGDLQIKNWKFTGLKYPVEKQEADGKITPVIKRQSQFPSDVPVKEYLRDKTVLHGDGDIIYKNSEKFDASCDMVYDNENKELYVSPEDFKTATGTEINYSEETKNYSDGQRSFIAPTPMNKDGKILIPSCAIAKALGYNAVYLEYGKMVMLSTHDDLPVNEDNNRSWFDDTFYSEGAAGYALTKFTQVQEISNFIFYDRPTAQKLEEDFNKITNRGAKHPRIGITAEIVDEIKNNRKTDALFNKKLEKYIATTEGKFENPAPKYEYSDGLRTLNAASKFREVAIPMAFCYQVTGEERFARRAIDDLLVVASFPDYNPGHVIDMGMWLKGMGIVYDWCYNAMTPQERKIVSDAIIKKGIEVINKAYYAELSAAVCTFAEVGASSGGASFFPKWKSNYVAYTQGGVIMAALAVAEDAPEICFDTLEKTFRSWEYSNFGFYSGGAWVEGKTYQNVVNENMAEAMSAVILSLNDDYNILNYPGVKENLYLLMNLNSKTASFTYADDNARDPWASIVPCYSFYSKYYGDERLAQWRQYKLGENGTGEWMDFAYYTPGSYTDKLEGLDKTSYSIGGEFFTVHEDWNDKNALFFATAGGPTRHYHFHNDGGDFLICMDGERWSYDLGQGNYNVGTNYTRYGGRTEAHNTLTINPDENYSQAEQSYAEIIQRGEGDGGAYAVMDMTSLYAHHGADKVWRGFYIGDNFDTFTVRDEMTFNKKANGYWFMTTEASAEKLDDETVILSKNGKTLVLQYKCEGANVKSSIDVMEAAPLPTSPQLANDNTAINPKLKKVAIYFEGSGDINLTVRMAALPGDVDLTPISQWTAPEKTEIVKDNFEYDVIVNGRKLDNKNTIYVADKKDITDFTIVPYDSSMTVEVEKVYELDKSMRIILRKPGTDRFAINSIKYAVDYDLGLEKQYVINNPDEFFVSATPEAANAGPNLMDKTFQTRWTGYDKGDFAQFDFGSVKEFDAAALGFWKGNERKYSFDVLISDDGENFTSAGSFTSNGQSEMYEVFEFPKVSGRYVRIVGQGNTVNNVINILECRLMKKK